MKTRLINLWETLRSSYWFVPGGLVFLGVLFAIASIAIDLRWGRAFSEVLREFRVAPEGARTVLSTTAAAILSMAAVSFSITIVTLTLASSQFGPRLVRNFVRSTPTQISLGGLLGTFVYCLVILGTTRSGENPFFVPFFSLGLAFLLTLFSIFLFIFFLHHVATSIQAETVIARVSNELAARIESYFPDSDDSPRLPTGCADPSAAAGDLDSLGDKAANAGALFTCSPRGAYLQAVDGETLVCIAEEENIYLELHHLPGHYLVPGEPILQVDGPGAGDLDRLRDRLLDAVILGGHQTAEQDYGFSIRQLVEIALRALSPGINDPFTALTCIDHLGGALAIIAQREMPRHRLRDKAGVVRLQMPEVTFAAILHQSIDQIRRDGARRYDIATRLLEILATLAALAHTAPQNDAIAAQARLVAGLAVENALTPADAEDHRAALDRVLSLTEA